MPWELRWVEPRKDPTLEVYAELPPEYEIHASASIQNSVQVATLQPKHWGQGRQFAAYHCRHCDGWILRIPREYHESSIKCLSGRNGIVYHCRRCGREVGFAGVMS